MKHPQLPKAQHGGASASNFTGLDFSVNTNPFGANPVLLCAAHAADPTQYPDPSYKQVRHALAAFHGLSPEDITLGVGASELLHRVTRALLPTGGAAVSVNPPFGEFVRAVQLERAELLTTTTTDALTLLRKVRPALVYTSRPNNPLGLILDASTILEIADWCASNDAVLILDEAYAPFAPHLEPLPAHASVIRLESPGKVHGLVGLRLAYALAPSQLTRMLNNLEPAWVLPASTAAALEAIPNAQSFVLETVPKVLALATDFATQLSNLSKVHHDSGPFFTLEVGDAPTVTRALLDRGFRVRDCTSYGYQTRIRVSTNLEPQNAELIKALAEVLHG